MKLYFLLFLLLMLSSNVLAMELSEIKLVDIDTMTVEAEARQNESYYTAPDGETYKLVDEYKRSYSSQANITNPVDEIADKLNSYVVVGVVITVVVSLIGSVMSGLRGGAI